MFLAQLGRVGGILQARAMAAGIVVIKAIPLETGMADAIGARPRTVVGVVAIVVAVMVVVVVVGAAVVAATVEEAAAGMADDYGLCLTLFPREGEELSYEKHMFAPGHRPGISPGRMQFNTNRGCSRWP